MVTTPFWGAAVAINNPRSNLSSAPHNHGRSIGGTPLTALSPKPPFPPPSGLAGCVFASVCSPPTPAASLRTRSIGGTPLTSLSPNPLFLPVASLRARSACAPVVGACRVAPTPLRASFRCLLLPAGSKCRNPLIFSHLFNFF